jgi:hypothetical protein
MTYRPQFEEFESVSDLLPPTIADPDFILAERLPDRLGPADYGYCLRDAAEVFARASRPRPGQIAAVARSMSRDTADALLLSHAIGEHVDSVYLAAARIAAR